MNTIILTRSSAYHCVKNWDKTNQVRGDHLPAQVIRDNLVRELLPELPGSTTSRTFQLVKHPATGNTFYESFAFYPSNYKFDIKTLVMRNCAYFGTSALLTIVICILQIVRFPRRTNLWRTVGFTAGWSYNTSCNTISLYVTPLKLHSRKRRQQYFCRGQAMMTDNGADGQMGSHAQCRDGIVIWQATASMCHSGKLDEADAKTRELPTTVSIWL